MWITTVCTATAALLVAYTVLLSWATSAIDVNDSSNMHTFSNNLYLSGLNWDVSPWKNQQPMTCLDAMPESTVVHSSDQGLQ